MSFVRFDRLATVTGLAIAITSSLTACSSDASSSGLATTESAQLPDPASDSPRAPSETTSATVESTDSPTDVSPSDGPDSPDAAGDTDTPPDNTATPPPAPPTHLRGTNLVGMEGGYGFNTQSGPVPDSDYAVHSTKIVDYLATKNVNVIRFLFSWERMQSTLGGPIPAASSGNYKSYFDDYKRIVDYATSKGMTVVVEPWQAGPSGAGGARWRGSLVGSGTVTSAHFADFWSKMAAVYASNPRVAIGLVNEPNGMSTMTWFGIAQDAVTAIRAAGFTGDIYVPGNGWTAAGSWTSSSYDTASTKRSNAYGWLNARGEGLPLLDPLGKSIVEVHSYADSDASGSSTQVSSSSVTRSRLSNVVDWAKTNGLKVWLGEVGMYASATNASSNWSDFVSYANSSTDTLTGFAWWACGKPGWWNDVAASGGGHFSITPTNDYKTDTVNMGMIEGSFTQ